jgi:hypothetical protein
MRCSCCGLAVVALSIFGAGCSSGPKPPQPGTPAFFLASAKSTYAAGDFIKTSENLSQIATDAEFGTRTEASSILISAGLAKGYADLAENYEYGGRANRNNPTPFRRQVTQYRNLAGAAAMQTTQSLHHFLDTNKVDPIVLEFGYPTGSAAEPVQLQRVAKGLMPPEGEIESLQNSMLQRGVLLITARAVAGSNDTAKALELFKTGEVKVPRATFLLAIGKALIDEADLYTPRKLDQPERLKVVCEHAGEAVGAVPQTAETKELLSKIQKLRNPGKKT